MKKIIFLFVFVLSCGFISTQAQTTETFNKASLTASYADGSFIGESSITWTYGHSRDEGDFPIEGKGIMLRRASDSYLEAIFPNGLQGFSFQYRKAFTGGSDRQIEVLINGTQVKTTEVFGSGSGESTTVYTCDLGAINYEGSTTVRIKNIGEATGNSQFTIDNVIWTPKGSGPIVSTDATLKSLKVDGTEILKSGEVDYAITLPETTTAVPSITYEKNHANATIGTVTLPTLEGIKNGSNNKAIIPVTAEDGTTSSTYTITFSIRTLGEGVIFEETCGGETVPNSPRPSPDTWNEWDNYGLVSFSGNTDIRSTSSMNAHVWFAAYSETYPVEERNLVISGINTSGKSDIKLSFDIAGNKTGSNATSLFVKVKNVTTGVETTLTVPSIELTQNVYQTVSNLAGVPATDNLEITFWTTAESNPTGYGFRLDNIRLTAGDAPVLSDNNLLSSLSVSAGTLNPAFDAQTTSYNVELAEGSSVPTVTYTLADSKATAVKTDAAQVPGTTTIVVTAENGNTKTYSIRFSYETPQGVWMETFETGVAKSTYAIGENPYEGVVVNWEAYAVISDTDEKDKKNGLFSARLRDPSQDADGKRDPHYIMMVEDKENGAGTISFYTGMYGTHTKTASILVEVSNNGGSTWNAFSKEVPVTTEWTKVTIDNVNITGDIRVKLTKQSALETGSTVNIDDIMITNYSGSGICTINDDSKSFVRAENNILYVMNAENNAQISVYDLTGKLIKQTSQTVIDLPAKGIYIVKVNNQIHKVVSK